MTKIRILLLPALLLSGVVLMNPALAKGEVVTSTPVKQASESNRTLGSKHLWNLQNVDIHQVVAEISRETGKNFIVDPQVSGKITIISSHPIGAEEAYQVFLSSLHVLGYAAVPNGNNLRIVPLREAPSQAMLANQGHPGVGVQVVNRVIPVHYVSALQLVPALRPLLPTWGNLAAYSPSNTLILSGPADSVARIAAMMKEIDTPSSNGIDVVSLKHAVAADIVEEVNRLILAARANGSSTNATLSADDNSNSILISGNKISRLHLKVLVAKLDQANANGTNNTQVIDLKYIRVRDILPILKGMVHQSVSYSIQSGAAASASSSSSTSSTGGTVLGQSSAQFQAAASQQIDNATLNSGASDSSNKTDPVTIVGDVTNNALIITANPNVMTQLRAVIGKLDVPPQQVLVESVIAEVDAQTANQLGVEWGTATPTGSSSEGSSGSVVSNYSYGGGGMGVGFIKMGDFRALVALLASDTNSNIVSTPSITVLNNSPADIEVGQNIPQVSAQYQYSNGQSGDVLPPTTYQNEQVGLTLKVIPQITGDNSVRLVIDQQNSALIDDATVKGTGPNSPTSTEQINTSVLVKNGQVLVLGGLINSQERRIVHKVPILGDIPLLGYLFRSYGTTKVKKDLMIFLRPVIVRSQQQASEITNKRYDFMRNVAILNNNNHGDLLAPSILPDRQVQALPAPFSDDN